MVCGINRLPPPLEFIFHFPMPPLLLFGVYVFTSWQLDSESVRFARQYEWAPWLLRMNVLSLKPCVSEGDEVRLLGGFSLFVFVCYFLAYVYALFVMHACLVSSTRPGVAQLHMTSIKTRGNSELITGTAVLIRNLSQPLSIFLFAAVFQVFFRLLSRPSLSSWMQINTHSSS